MNKNSYDLSALRQRAALWRAEAAAAPDEAMRSFCLNEAVRCERCVEMSLSTPVFSETVDHSGESTHSG